ncbi:hypothetical protein ACTFIW_003485 [Dictyostelium discoideum]
MERYYGSLDFSTNSPNGIVCSVTFNDKGLKIRIGEYSDEESLVKAFEGIEKLLFISSSDIENRIDHHNNVIKAAKKVGTIKHLAYTSFFRKEDVEKSGNSSIDFVGKHHIILSRSASLAL